MRLTKSEDGWVLKTGSTFPLTLLGVDGWVAREVERILDQNLDQGKSIEDIAKLLVPIIVKTNLRVKEIEIYIKWFRPQYLRAIKELQAASPEWKKASEEEKADLLDTFRLEAEEALEVKPYFDLTYWFENPPPSDMREANALIERYGYDSTVFYLKNCANIEQVHITRPGTPLYRKFDKLVELGLARRGNDIPASYILERLKLKELNNITSDLKQSFKQKKEALEFIAKLPDVYERLGRVIDLRSVFQLKPLPKEFFNVDLEKVSNALDYAWATAWLLTHTYMSAHYPPLPPKEFIRGWRVSAVRDFLTCPYCEKMDGKVFPRDRYPKVPFHIGCRCVVEPLLEEED